MKGIAVIAILLGVFALLVFGPIITIWALNTLFALHIPVTFGTWFAALWCGLIVGGAKPSIKLK